MNYFLAYYLASVVMAAYMSKKKQTDFEVKIGGRKVRKEVAIVLGAPFVFPLLCQEVYKEYKGKHGSKK